MATPAIQVKAFTLPANTALHRIQRIQPLPTTVTIGWVRLPPTGLLLGRFDLPKTDTAAFALSDLTAIYETMARRDVSSVSLKSLTQRELLSVTTNASLHLADFRPQTAPWPLLIANRYGPTQSLADDAFSNQYQGVIYLSAQEHMGECVALFGTAIANLTPTNAVPLATTTQLHSLIAQALIGTMLPLTP